MKKGFTLIELLAVIVILAIIALIATPIILGIINDARQESNERSIELYIGAVRNGVAAYQLRTGNKVEAGIYDKENPLPFEVEVEGNVECETIEIKDSGEVIVSNCTVNGNKIDDNEENEEELPIVKGKLDSVCKPAKEQLYTTNPYESGYKYECKVDPNKDRYTFYVLNSDTTSVNLIMDSNIRTGGVPVKEANPTEEQKGLIAWITKEDYTSLEIGGTETGWNESNHSTGNLSKGPITAMNHLQTITQNWTNVNVQTITIFETCKFVDSTKADCTNKQMAKTYKVYARLPYFSEAVEIGCNVFLGSGTCPAWMVYHLNEYTEKYPNKPSVVGVEAYHFMSTMSLASDTTFGTLDLYYKGAVGFDGDITTTSRGGVRPVINLSI